MNVEVPQQVVIPQIDQQVVRNEEELQNEKLAETIIIPSTSVKKKKRKYTLHPRQ